MHPPEQAVHPPYAFFYQNAIPFPEKHGNSERIAVLCFLCYDERADSALPSGRAIRERAVEGMEIRYLRASDDREAISRIYEESWRAAYRGIVPQAYLDAIPKGQWAKSPDIPGWYTLVCTEKGSCVGTGCFSRSRSPQYPEAGEVISLYLLPEYWGKGFGRPLLEAVLGELKKQGFSEVFLWVLEENSRARRFYEKQGFSRSGESLDVRIGGKTLRELRYVRSLA